MHQSPSAQSSVEAIKAVCNDILAAINGASEYERRIRRERGVALYHGDATFREIMIRLDVLNRPWWA